jgi:hypothetical protein
MSTSVRVMRVPASSASIEVVSLTPDLDALQAEVGGDIEGLFGAGWAAYLNEEGKMRGLPINDRADALARALGWQSLPGDVLCGDVVFLGPCDEEGYDTDVPNIVIAAAGELSLLPGSLKHLVSE